MIIKRWAKIWDYILRLVDKCAVIRLISSKTFCIIRIIYSCFYSNWKDKTGFFVYLGKEINGERHEKKRPRN